MALESDGDIRRRAIPVLYEHDVRFPGTRRLLLVHVLSVNHHDHVGILLDTVMKSHSVGDKIVPAEHGGVEYLLLRTLFNRYDLVPEDVVDRLHLQFGVSENVRDTT